MVVMREVHVYYGGSFDRPTRVALRSPDGSEVDLIPLGLVEVERVVKIKSVPVVKLSVQARLVEHGPEVDHGA